VKRFTCTLILFTWFAGSLSAAEKPNIVILYADDMGYGDLGANNPDSKIPTPHLDQLAKEGLRLTDGHSSSGICTPSRYALLTGRYHWRKFHDIVHAFGPPVIDAQELTLAEVLKEKGYHTACIGKWHLGWNWDEILQPDAAVGSFGRNRVIQPEAFDWSKPISGGPTSHGFDEYFGDDVPNFPPYAWFKNDRVIGQPSVMLTRTPKTPEGSWNARPGPAVKDWDFWAVVPRLADEAVDWIAQQKGKEDPFFLYVPFNSPHSPIVPTQEFVGSSQAGPFGDFVHMTDAMAGKILAALKENGFEDNTLVIFTADNGAEKYAYERVKNFGHWSSAPFRGVKRDLYEGGHHVPFVVKWPGKIKPGSTSNALISQVDLMGTIAAIVDYQLPEDSAHDSYNQLLVWLSDAASPRETIVHNTNAKAYAIRDGDWLLVDAKSGSHNRIPAWFNEQRGYQEDKLPGELYNLRDDPAQKKNLYDSQPEVVQRLKQELSTIQASGQVR